MIYDLFFELLQVALEEKEQLYKVPSDEEWNNLFEESQRQGIVGVMLHGVDLLPKTQRPSTECLLEWIGISHMIQAQNKLMDERCLSLLRKLDSFGIKASILKGQGIAKLYQTPDGMNILSSLRQPGDIDVFVACEREKVINIIERIGIKVRSWDYKHAHLEIWNDTEVELHYRVEIMFNLIKNHRLQEWFKENEIDLFYRNEEWVTPSIDFNMFYILLHIYRHFFTEGVGMRQIVDYYFVLKSYSVNRTHNCSDKFLDAVTEFGMERFARGLMWVLQQSTAMSTEWMPWPPDEKEGLFLLSVIMEGGNFGHYSNERPRYNGKIAYVISLTRHCIHLLHRYPTESIWTPIWIIYNKIWKLLNKK